MRRQRRTQLLVGGLFLAAVALVAALLLTNQTRSGAVVESTPPSTTTAVAAATDVAAADAPGATTSVTPTATVVASQAESPVAVAAVVTSPLATPAALITPTAYAMPAATAPSDDAAATPKVPPTASAPATPTQPPPVSSGSEGIPIYGYEIVATYPHDPDAFTQGLQIIDDVLYEGTGLYGQSSLRRVELETGEVLQQINLAGDLFGEGIVVVDERIYQLTWQARRGFIYDRASFERIDEFSYSTEGWGLTFDGDNLVMSDGTNRLFWRDPATLEVVREVDVLQQDVPVPLLNELEYVAGEIFANVWQTDWIARIDPATGRVVGWIDLSGLLDGVEMTRPVDVLNGIAYDATNDRLFVTGKLWPILFEIELIER